MTPPKPQEPEALGTGLGPLLADYVPLLPSGARRAGAAKVMAARSGTDPSFMIKHPIASQLLALGGGAIAGQLTQSPLAAILPIVAVQALKRHEMQGIQSDYDTKKRLRLRDIDSKDLLGGWGGSARLGAVGAYEAMRKRKYQNIGALSEAGDALTLGAGVLGPLGTLASIPVTSAIDHRSANRLLKQAFTQQKNSPVIPLYLAAALGSGLGQNLAAENAQASLLDAPPLPRGEWQGLVDNVSGQHPLTTSVPDLGNAYYSRAKDPGEAAAAVRDFVSDRTNSDAACGHVRSLFARAMKDGVVRADPRLGTSAVLAHEGGHGAIDHQPGLANFLQNKVYPYQRLISPLAGVGSMAAGLASGSALKGLLAGTGIGLLSGTPTLIPEAMASWKGWHALQDYKGGALAQAGDAGRQLSALGTYAAGAVLPSMLAGAAGGWISGRRKKQEDEDAEKQAGLGNTLRRAVGRIVTNTVDPNGGFAVLPTLAIAAKHGLVGNIKAIVSDTPTWADDLAGLSKIKPAYFNTALAHDFPYRRMFGLPARTGRDQFTKTGPGTFKINTNSEGGAQLHDAILMGSHDEILERGMQPSEIPAEGVPYLGRTSVLGRFNGKLLPGASAAYSDRWDFDLHPHENALASPSNAARWLMSKITKPITIEGVTGVNYARSPRRADTSNPNYWDHMRKSKAEMDAADAEYAAKQANWGPLKQVAELAMRAGRVYKAYPDAADRMVRMSNLAGGASYKQLKDVVYNGSQLLRDASPGRKLAWPAIRDLADRKLAERAAMAPAAAPTNMTQDLLNL